MIDPHVGSHVFPVLLLFLFFFCLFGLVFSSVWILRCGWENGVGYLGGLFDLIFFLLNFQRKNITSRRANHSIQFNESGSRDHFLLTHGYYPLLDIYLIRQYIYFQFTSRLLILPYVLLLRNEFSSLCLIRPKQIIEITSQPLHSPRITLMIDLPPGCRCG